MNKNLFWIIGIFLFVILFFGKITGFSIFGGGDLEFPLSEIELEAQYYEVDGIEFFAVRALDGIIRTAFNACDICYGSHKGYRQEGEFMICNNCGNSYPISGLGTKNLAGGGCWPGYLPNKIEGEFLIINKNDIEKGRYRFE